MTLLERLEARAATLVEEAATALEQARLRHYDGDGPAAIRERMTAELAAVLQSLRDGSPVAVIEHADRIAGERFRAGFGIEEILVAYNTLEEAIWRFLVAEPESAEGLADDLGRIGSVLGAGKDELARAYVALVALRHAPSVDVQALHDLI